MRKVSLIICYVLGLHNVNAQVMIYLQLPPAGFSAKSQLWNLSITNAGNTAINTRLKIVMVDIATGEPVLSGSSNIFSLPTGVKLLTYNDVLPVNYTTVNGNYGVDGSPNGLLPVGNFNICLEVEKVESDTYESIVEECATIQVEPLSPPYLSNPQDQSIVPDGRPAFSWIPPAPMNLFSNLTYAIKLVTVSPAQNPDDAIQQNLSLISMPRVLTNSCQYPSANSVLDTGKLYAWQVVANNNSLFVAKSEVWTFKVKGADPVVAVPSIAAPYFKLNENNTAGYFICNGVLRFEYFNELNDTAVAINVYDTRRQYRSAVDIGIKYLAVRYGQNLIDIDVTGTGALLSGHIYSVELINSKQENWKGKFEYKRTN